MHTTASPRASSMPAEIATWWPKLREKLTTRTDGSSPWKRSRMAGEPSVEPSFT